MNHSANNSSPGAAWPTILLVDDEPNILELGALYLADAQYKIVTAENGAQALELLDTTKPDLIVLDLMLPDLDGWEVCRQIRRYCNIPIIMLTARSADVDKIIGLELGADDYITKPFNPRELVARVRAVLRREQREPTPDQAATSLELGMLRLDPARREAFCGARQLTLRTREFDLLHCLLEHAGMALSRDQLLSQVWGYDYAGETRTVDVHIAQLRKELGNSDVAIETVWGIGYKLTGPQSISSPTSSSR